MKQNVRVGVVGVVKISISPILKHCFGMFRIFCFAAKTQVIYNPNDFLPHIKRPPVHFGNTLNEFDKICTSAASAICLNEFNVFPMSQEGV